MFRKVLCSWGLVTLAGAAVLLTAAPAGAQGHFGGAHFGGFHSGHVGGYNPSFGYHPGYGYRAFSGSHPEYGYRPYYNYGGTYPYLYYPYYGSSYGSGGGDDPWYTETYGDPPVALPPSYTPDTAPGARQTPPYPSAAVTATRVAELDPTAHIAMRVPEEAEIWFDGVKTTSTGEFRAFQSPPLTPGRRYAYEVRARWGENGHEVTQTQKVTVSAGADVTIRFPAEILDSAKSDLDRAK